MAAPPTTLSVSGKTAIITGAGSGINLCFASLLLSRNCNVLIADLSLRPEAQKLVDEHSAKDTDKAHAVFVKTDVTKWPDLQSMFDAAYAEFDGFDIVCPGAGVYEPPWSNFWHPPGSASSRDPAAGEKGAGGLGHYALLDINITHPIRVTQLAIAEFISPREGSKMGGPVSVTNPKRIVHISSIAGQLASLVAPMYHASKWAISGFIRSLDSLDSTLGIRVNGVAPGLIKTPLWTESPEKIKYVDESRDAWATPEEVAEAMLACVEDERYRGGTVLEVGHKQTRMIGMLNDPGPSGEGHMVSHMQKGIDEVFESLKEDGWGKGGK
ncbi:hypothetical protein W97_04856 [Coniosporium apollinis CBS 100218]|uniref:3-hydroxybutyrate dehydrogenase n=1 Tax=Coniosporium apollinis (strain CBS 100218) TaxID=1168221 RepID=R7YUQ6_CONA1|nr:uncharacterized protein W97_04856 [Coniosporium apollinis CBS 100218]EON65617.1 hypothetical protein W97_04856 [Coniosporium apollinis CBS 100218]